MPTTASARPHLGSSFRRRRAVISLTPLIDVVFILLVFFMLASSFLDWRSIELGAPGDAGAGAGFEGAMLVEIRADGLRLAGHAASLEEVEARLAKRLADKPDQRVLVKPAAGVALQRAVDVLDRLSRAGVRSPSLIRDR